MQNKYGSRTGGSWGGNNSKSDKAPKGKQTNNMPAPVKAVPLPADYVDEAERVMQELMKDWNRITTSKLRNFLALITDIYNAESLSNYEQLLSASQAKLMRLRVKIVYDAGREQTVKTFVQKSHLLEYIKDVGTDRNKLIQLAHYMEALVAYHKYLGGKEN